MPPNASTSRVSSVISDILAPPFLRNLGRLRLSVRRALGGRPGNTPVPRVTHPTGIELESYKPYGPGDEPRFLDWNAYARLDQLLVRRFRAEREAPLHILLDTSASMGQPEVDAKLRFGVGLALSFAYIAARHNDPVRLVLLGDYGAARHVVSPVVRLPQMFQRITDFCRPVEPRGGTALLEGVEAYLQRTRNPGFAIIISDFLTEPDLWRTAMRRLASRRFEMAALRLLGSSERDPSGLFRRGRLRDVESGAERVISLSPSHLALYRQALEQHLAQLREYCAGNSAFFAVCDTAAGLEHCLFRQLPQMGLVR